MEKRRRARINNCLNELKTLILDAMKKDVSTIVNKKQWESRFSGIVARLRQDQSFIIKKALIGGLPI